MKLKEEKWLLIFEWLRKNKESVATMESCTGGYIANIITNHKNASDIFALGIVSYSSQSKIDSGVSKEVIDKYTVYSKETAEEMAKVIARRANATYGIGITGELSKENGVTYICIYNSKTKKSHYQTVSVNLENRGMEKIVVANLVIDLFFQIVGLI